VIKAGFDPKAALALLEDFSRFENPSPFLRTHPYAAQRRADLQRYVSDSGALPATDRIKQLRDAQRLYPVGSVSWKNLQRQIEELEGRL
jgi:predicted Zn-dependent protease